MAGKREVRKLGTGQSKLDVDFFPEFLTHNMLPNSPFFDSFWDGKKTNLFFTLSNSLSVYGYTNLGGSRKRGSEMARRDRTVAIADPLTYEIESSAVGGSSRVPLRMRRCPFGVQAV